MPIEVKAKNGTSKSLRTLIASETYADVKFGIKFCAGNIGCDRNIVTVPYYLAFLLRRVLRTWDETGFPEGLDVS